MSSQYSMSKVDWGRLANVYIGILNRRQLSEVFQRIEDRGYNLKGIYPLKDFYHEDVSKFLTNHRNDVIILSPANDIILSQMIIVLAKHLLKHRLFI